MPESVAIASRPVSYSKDIATLAALAYSAEADFSSKLTWRVEHVNRAEWLSSELKAIRQRGMRVEQAVYKLGTIAA